MGAFFTFAIRREVYTLCATIPLQDIFFNFNKLQRKGRKDSSSQLVALQCPPLWLIADLQS